MKLIEKVKKIYFPMYCYTIYIVYTNDIVGSRKKRDSKIGLYEEASNDYAIDGMHCYNEYYPEAFIFFDCRSDEGTIAHESYHAIRRMFRYIGDDNNVSNEVFAYSLGYLVREIYKVLKVAKQIKKK